MSELSTALANVDLVAPKPDPKAVKGLKFSAALPKHLATATLGSRLADFRGASTILGFDRQVSID